MVMEITLILLNAQSADGTVRKQAKENLKQFQEQNLAGFLLSLVGELSSDDKPVDSCKLAGLIFKNALDAKEQYKKFELVQRWLSLDVPVKFQIKTCLLHTLSSLVPDARSTASQVITKLAGIKLPQKQWPELIGSLLAGSSPCQASHFSFYSSISHRHRELQEDCFYDLPYNTGYQIFVLRLWKTEYEIMKCTLSIYVDIYFD